MRIIIFVILIITFSSIIFSQDLFFSDNFILNLEDFNNIEVETNKPKRKPWKKKKVYPTDVTRERSKIKIYLEAGSELVVDRTDINKLNANLSVGIPITKNAYITPGMGVRIYNLNFPIFPIYLGLRSNLNESNTSPFF